MTFTDWIVLGALLLLFVFCAVLSVKRKKRKGGCGCDGCTGGCCACSKK